MRAIRRQIAAPSGSSALVPLRPEPVSRTRRTFLLAGVALFAGGRRGFAQFPNNEPGVYLGPYMPYGAFDALAYADLDVRGAVVRAAFAPGALDLAKADILRWVESCAQTVAIYYDRFPVEYTRLLIVPVGGGGVRTGTTYAHRGAAIKLQLGARTSPDHLVRDWVMVHEMVHLAFPSMNRRHHWIEEGLATYVEGVARAQAGQLDDTHVWAGLVDGMPKGLPRAGDRGLDHTPTWGRTYWGGALFCLLADVEIRWRSGNRKGLQDALRGILAAGGNMEVRWPIAKALRIGDDAVGTPVLTELYDQMKDRPASVDLPTLWDRLGVEPRRGAVAFRDDAPLAAIRQAITATPRPS